MFFPWYLRHRDAHRITDKYSSFFFISKNTLENPHYEDFDSLYTMFLLYEYGHIERSAIIRRQ